MKNASVAVLNLFLNVIYQALIIDKKCHCYGTERTVKLFGFDSSDLSSSGLLLPFNCQENKLSLVISKIVYKGLKGLWIEGLSLSCAASRLYDLFQVAWREAKKAKWITAHNYKKCDRQV